ncbi:MAG: peptidase M48, partial [Acetobacteraceae bacterium]
MLLPLALLGLGLWQQPRGRGDLQTAEVRSARLTKVVAALEARPAPARGFDYGAVFREDGHTYAGPLALDKARDARDRQDTTVLAASLRRWLPPAVIACGAAVGLLSVLALTAAAGLGRLGRRSRDALVRGFSLVRHLLPPLLGAQILLLAIGVVAAVGFEASAVMLGGRFSSGTAQLLGFAALVVGTSLWTALRAVVQLRRAVALFTPDPLPIIGRTVSPAEAPGLWRMVDGLAARLGALRPDNVAVGLTGGFFVSSGPKLLRPGDAALDGRTLYLPMPFLALLPEDEVAAIIGHELAHFSGGDTEYSLSFLPIYAGVGRSLDAVAEAGRLGDGTVSPLLRPALRLGVFVMDQFHHAVRHWSRLREFAADTAGAGATSAAAAARALLRTSAAEPRIGEVLAPAFRAPRDAPDDLLAAILRSAAQQGLDDPAAYLEEQQPHPTDT